MATTPGGAQRPAHRPVLPVQSPPWASGASQPLTQTPSRAPRDESITVELAGVTRVVQRSQVLYVEAQGDYARLHTERGSHLIRVPLSTLAERWAEAGFVQIHRSTLVALPHVDEVTIEGGRFCLRLRGRTLQVSRRHTRELRELLLRGAEPDPAPPGR